MSIAEQIAERGWAICYDFLPEADLEALAAEARALWSRGLFKKAGVGASSSVRPQVRGDLILWLDEGRLTRPQARYWAEIEKLKLELNRELFAGLIGFEAHYALYPPGAFYKKHVDRLKTSDLRVISCVLYLNRDWRPEHGGALRIYADQSHVDVLPQIGTFVAFRSDAVIHEVLPTLRERFSLTGWFKRRPLLWSVALDELPHQLVEEFPAQS